MSRARKTRYALLIFAEPRHDARHVLPAVFNVVPIAPQVACLPQRGVIRLKKRFFEIVKAKFVCLLLFLKVLRTRANCRNTRSVCRFRSGIAPFRRILPGGPPQWNSNRRVLSSRRPIRRRFLRRLPGSPNFLGNRRR